MRRALIEIVVVIGLSSVPTAFASFHFTQSPAVHVPNIATLMLSLQPVNPHDGTPDNSGTIPGPNGGGAISIADIIGIVLFFALLTALFVLCRKGVFPETSCFCDPPAWLRRIFTKSGRRAGA